MKTFLRICTGALVLAASAPGVLKAQTATKKVQNFFNVIAPDSADPWVFRHSDGLYYWVHSARGRIELLRSATLAGLDAGESKVAWTPEPSGPASKELWAPELHHLKDKWYIYVAADDGDNAHHKMYVLENGSKNPFEGTFQLKGQLKVPDEDRWAIDGTALEVNDRLYFVWSGWEGFENVSQNLYIAPMSDPTTISGPRVLISKPEREWEKQGGSPLINEGPEAIVRNGRVFLVYSASGSWSDFYCLGMLTAKTDADLLSPKSWTKSPEPVFQSGHGVIAPGHASFTKSPDGQQDWIVYHTARFPGAGWTRLVRTQPFSWTTDGQPDFGAPVPSNQPIPLPSGEPSRWRVEAESGKVLGQARVAPEEEASAGSKVGFLDDPQSGVSLEVEVPSAGVYGLAIRYDNGTEGNRHATHLLSVNGGNPEKVVYPFTQWKQWSNAFTRVPLKKGRNLLTFRQQEGFAEIDCVDLWVESDAKNQAK
ncbi:MAG TPA: family 43 glycosylhydrolase [Isosphaeraceae bacterium]|nr:family 43 glycosylhydrolase [Isosphaeraceae bacterium]